MKKIFLALLVIASVTSCKKDEGGNGGGGGTTSGPTISSSNVGGTYTPGRAIKNYRLDSGIIKIPTAGTNLMFNYSNVTPGANFTDSSKAPNNPTDYPTATYMMGINQNILNNNINFTNFYSINSSSWSELGSYIGDTVTIPIPTIGSIVIPKKAAKNSPAQTYVNFPIAYGDSIAQVTSNTITTLVNAQTTVSGFPITLNKEPLNITTQTTVASKNIAWGLIKVKGYTDSSDVVVQRYTTTTKLTFAFNNALYNAALGTLLQSYGVTNGQETTTTMYRFWTKKGLIMRLESNGVAFVRTDL